jgi:hypothetical protein
MLATHIAGMGKILLRVLKTRLRLEQKNLVGNHAGDLLFKTSAKTRSPE